MNIEKSNKRYNERKKLFDNLTSKQQISSLMKLQKDYESKIDKKNNIKTKVKIVNITKLNIPKEFDLVKIDVEGSELEVLESLNKIKFKYLYIESVNGNNLVEIIDKVRNRNPKLISFRDNLNLLLRMEK